MHVRSFAGMATLIVVALSSLALGVASATGAGASLNLKLKPKHPTEKKSRAAACIGTGGCTSYKIIASGTTDQPNTQLRMFYNPVSHPCEQNESTEEGGSVVGGQFSQINQANATFPKAGPFSKTVKQQISGKASKSLICGYLVTSDGTTEKVAQILFKPGKKHHK